MPTQVCVLMSDDIFMFSDFVHLAWSHPPSSHIQKFKWYLVIILKPFLAPCLNTLNTDSQTWLESILVTC